jgi:hypothetical protein
MAVGVRSFSCKLELDTKGSFISTFTILKNTFSVTPTLIDLGSGIAGIRFSGIQIEAQNTIMNLNFGLTLISLSAGIYDGFGIEIPTFTFNSGSFYSQVSFTPTNIRPATDIVYGGLTSQPYFFNMKELYTI